MQAEMNKLGLTLKDYKCSRCGFIHAPLFLKHKPLRRCRRCRKEFKQQ